MMLTLQQDDELHIYIEDARFCFFPFPQPKVIADFEEAVRGLVEGTVRVAIYERRHRTAKATLERRLNGEWTVIASYFHTFWPFGLSITRTVQNQSNSLRQQAN